MDPTAPPWRALEDPTERRAPQASSTPSPSRIPRSAVVVVGAAGMLAVLAFLLAFGTNAGGTVVVDGGTPLESQVSDSADGDPGSISSADPELVVEIVGAVDRPGVYRLAPGSRIGDLVDVAGGYGARVDTDRASHELNLAAQLHDGDQVRVPSRDDAAVAGQPTSPAGPPVNGGSAAAGPLDLNRATSAELEALPGIGPVTAGKILASREEHAFGVVDDLRTRKLVGEKTFEKLNDLVTVR